MPLNGGSVMGLHANPWENTVSCISPRPGRVGKGSSQQGWAEHATLGCCVLQQAPVLALLPSLTHLPGSGSGTTACSGHVCAALWLFLVLKNPCSAFMVLFPGLLISALTTLAQLCYATIVWLSPS